jgi:hypothetical protein
MTNVFGEEIEPRKLTFEWSYPHLNLFINGRWSGMISPNGWQGHSMNIDHKLGEPVMTNVHLWHTLSVSEMMAMVEEFEKHMDGREMLLVIGQLAKEKKMSFNEAEAYATARNIPFFRAVTEKEREITRQWKEPL